MSEQELFLLGDDRGKDEEHVQKMLNKHNAIENAIIDYGDTIQELELVANGLVEEEHPERYKVFYCLQVMLELRHKQQFCMKIFFFFFLAFKLISIKNPNVYLHY